MSDGAPITFTSDDRFARSVLGVCETLHGSLTGSLEGLPDDEIDAQAEWLAWRITAGWTQTPESFPLGHHRYDRAVRMLARATLAMAMTR